MLGVVLLMKRPRIVPCLAFARKLPVLVAFALTALTVCRSYFQKPKAMADVQAASATPGPGSKLRILMLSLEYRSATFSGNGIYAQALVRALRGHGAAVMVLSGRPRGDAASSASREPDDHTHRVLEIPLSSWGKLDVSSSWEEFAEGMASYVSAVQEYRPHVVLGVDWTALRPFQRLRADWGAEAGSIPPLVYMNFRVFAASSGISQSDEAFYRRMEGQMCREAAAVVALSHSDADFLEKHFFGPSPGDAGPAAGPGAWARPRVLLPPLRADVHDLALAHPAQASQAWEQLVPGPAEPSGEGSAPASSSARRYLTCCVRLSAEKEAHRFAELVEALARRGVFAARGCGRGGGGGGAGAEACPLAPALCAPLPRSPYAEQVVTRVQAAAPAAVVFDRFLSPAELAALYGRTRLNVHPPEYDAYGMTIVEAAAFGAPSLIHDAGQVGAAHLLRPEHGEIVARNLTQPIDRVAEQVLALLTDPAGAQRCEPGAHSSSDRESNRASAEVQELEGLSLRNVGELARARSLQWSERSNGLTLLKMIQEVCSRTEVEATPDTCVSSSRTIERSQGL